MTVLQVNSGAIATVEYHFKKQELEVLFRHGETVTYKKVPKGVYEEFLNADSKGRYFNYNIRDVYPR